MLFQTTFLTESPVAGSVNTSWIILGDPKFDAGRGMWFVPFHLCYASKGGEKKKEKKNNMFY